MGTPAPSMEDRTVPLLPEAPPDLPPGLVYVNDTMPGIHRVRRGRGFVFLDPDGRPIKDPEEIARIQRLAIPPAYTKVWICPLANGHLQATGRDARGRKQYRYHPLWREVRDADKFARMEAFGRALPRIRQRVTQDLRGAESGLISRHLVLATIVRLLDTTFIRVGNDEYARENGSYGLTTLRSRHAGVRGGTLKLSFRGKSGVMHKVEVEDRRIAKVVRRCQQLPGQALFHYEDPDGTVRSIDSGDVNDYLAEAAGARFTAKDFRTWHGTVQALELTRQACGGSADYTAKQILAEVARQLGNTVAVCRKAYIHPAVLDLGKALSARGERTDDEALWTRLEGSTPPVNGLRAAERRLLAFLEDVNSRMAALQQEAEAPRRARKRKSA